MSKVTPGQETDDENSAASDPNLVGPQATQGIEDRRAGGMTPCWEYSQKDPFYGKNRPAPQ